MNKRDVEILKWVEEHNPQSRASIVGLLKAVVGVEQPDSLAEALYSLTAMGFEAGRVFQCANDGVSPNNPTTYIFEDFHPCPKCGEKVGCEAVDLGSRHWGRCINCSLVKLSKVG